MKSVFVKNKMKFQDQEQLAEAGKPVRRRQRGSIMLLTALLMTVMIGILALSIDVGFVFSSRHQFQNGIDAAALAAASGLRLTIESSASAPQQRSVAEELAVKYAGLNQVRRYSDPGKDDPSPNANRIVITAGNVSVQDNFDLPRVTVNADLPISTLFAGFFGLNTFTIKSVATATVFPVDGGNGTMSAGTSNGNGGWRPLMLPDTFYDQSNNVHWVGDPSRGGDMDHDLPKQPGDYYRSRFAAGAREVIPYLDSYSGGGGVNATGLRDTRLTTEIDGNQTILGRYVEFKLPYYRIANLATLPRLTAELPSLDTQANLGYYGQIRVGDDVSVYSKDDLVSYERVRLGLQSMTRRVLDSDFVDPDIRTQFHYIKSGAYPVPNTHGAIIPVMLFNPVEIARNPDVTQVKITNIGLFFLEEVRADGTLRGFFVREIFSGGTPIDSSNMSVDRDPSFKRSWLPMSVQMVK